MLSPRAAHRAWGRRMRRSVRWNFAVLPVTLGRRQVRSGRSGQPPALGVCQRGLALKVRRSDHHIDHGFSRPGAEHERPRYLERAGSARRSQANASSSAHGTASHARASSAPQCACTASVRCARLAWAMGNTGSHSRSPVSHSACETPTGMGSVLNRKRGFAHMLASLGNNKGKERLSLPLYMAPRRCSPILKRRSEGGQGKAGSNAR